LKRKVPIKFDLYMNSITFTKENYGYEASSTIVIINSYLQFMTGSYCSLSLSLSLSIYIYIYIYMYYLQPLVYVWWLWFKPKTWLLGRKRFNRIYITKIQTRGSIPIDSTTAWSSLFQTGPMLQGLASSKLEVSKAHKTPESMGAS